MLLSNYTVRFVFLTLGVMVFCIPALSSSSFAEETGRKIVRLSLQETLRQAYVYNPTLKAARSRLKAVHEQLPQALSGYRPTITADGTITTSETDGSNFGGGDGSTSKDVGVSLNQPLFRGFRTLAESNAAAYTIRSQEQVLRATEQDVLLDAATAYMDVLRDQALLRLSENNRDVLDRELEATTDRFDVGELTRTDVSQAQARLARAESSVISARGTLNSSRAVFEQVVGIEPIGLYQPNMILPLPENLQDAILKAENQSPIVVSSMNSHRASEEDIDDVFGELLPEVGFFAQWNKTLDPQPGIIEDQTTKSLGISATIPLYQAGAVRSRIREAKHTANQRYLEVLEAKRQAREETVRNWENLEAARAEIRSRKAQVEASKVAREGVSEEADLGSRTILDLLDADQELLDAQVELVSTERNEVVARFALLATLGELSPEMLDFVEYKAEPEANLKDVKWKFFEFNVDRVGPSE